MDFNFKEKVQQMVARASMRKEKTWETFQEHSANYAKVLNLSANNLVIIEQEVQEIHSMYPDIEETGIKGFLNFDLDGENFSLAVKHVCGAHYGGEWRDYIFAICMSNHKLNQTIGNGTTTISVVPADWHTKIINLLKCDNIKPKPAIVVPLNKD